ncbi:dihydroflavonol-4-reductase [Angulomicrobium tetraedrale]|uniref:Dihydroflavonol-4-reductase n=1 Tax=Ancylobacter tetraedralis TaxID=217068 RepID=A0A839Z650_9HYPH|nr:aldehyde reductase [Ancylobacter tetraedralis]MBB3770503.1 dihydroflavonol-4-reductase [Ancylobacter tetraedralis]
MARVLVTGGTGFIAAHVIRVLLAAGHTVRASLRDRARAGALHALLAAAGTEPGDRLTFAIADLERDAGWAEASAGMDHVLHVASPFPAGVPTNPDELIRPAVDGTLRVLRAARDAGVRRVVVTSSFAAIGYGQDRRKTYFDERDWTRPEGRDVQPYMKSKTLAERAAWDFIAHAGGTMELVTVNPVGVFGPALGPDLSTSVSLIKAMLDGAIPACPRLYFGVVDVRDVAELHLKAMTNPAAAGERFLATAGDCLSMQQVAQCLRAHLGHEAARVPRFELPDPLVRLAALAMPMARAAVPQLGIVRNASSAKARRLLGWTPRPAEEAILASAESLIRLGLVKG